MAERIREVRGEDAFDVGALHEWLSGAVGGLGPEPPAVRQFSGGASNLTYLLTYPSRELVLRRPPGGRKASGAHDMTREARIQRRLHGHFPVPEVLAVAEDGGPLDAPFYVMERLEGVIPGPEMPPELGGSSDPAAARRVAERFVELFAQLHAVDPVATGLDEFARGDGYVRRQVAGWSERYRQARTWNVPDFEGVMKWLEDNQPPDAGSVLIHNDFRLDNVVFDSADPDRVAGVLDWEMATIGDPLMDLGGSLAYWVRPEDGRIAQGFRTQPTHLPGMPTREELVRMYGEASGRDVSAWRFYEAFGAFRLAVIAQQIYFRYHHKQTRNPKFRFYWVAVRMLHRRVAKGLR